MTKLATNNRRVWPRILNDESGANMVEVAIASLIMFTMMFSILQFSLVLYMHHFLALAAQEGSRYAIVRGSSWSSACSTTRKSNCVANVQNVSDFVKSLSPISSVSNSMQVSTTWPGTDANGSSNPSTSNCSLGSNSPGCAVKVEVSYQGSILNIPLSLVPSLTFKNSSTLTIVQ